MKPKTTFPRNTILWILVAVLVLAGIIALVTAFNGGGSGEDEVSAVYTNAAATVAAQQLTLIASAPSATPTLSVTQTATSTVAPLASPTLFTAQSIASNTPGSSGGSTAVGCNNSAYVADVTFPDDTVVTPGQTFTKTWKLSNTGSCPWTTAYKVSFVSGNAMGGVATPLTITVAPGASGDVSVAMTAPATAGDAIGYWILTSDGGQNFGSSFYVKVKVGGAGTTGTPGTATATSTGVVAAPAAPTNLDIPLSCNLGGTGGIQYEYVGTLTWTDNSTNETGFNIYINGSQVASVAPNIPSYTLPAGIYFDPKNPIFAVEAVNTGVKSAQATASELCP